MTECYFWGLLIVSLLPFTNFVVYIAKIRLKVSDIRNQVNKERDTLMEECKKNTEALQMFRKIGEYAPLAIRNKDEESPSTLLKSPNN